MLVPMCHPYNELVNCQGCTPPPAQHLPGSVPAPRKAEAVLDYVWRGGLLLEDHEIMTNILIKHMLISNV